MARKKQTSKGEPPEPADEHDQKLLADVGRHGWHVVGWPGRRITAARKKGIDPWGQGLKGEVEGGR